jgi:class 3 adenylate cyclase/predicted ATPase
MLCQECGSANPEGARFCLACGSRVIASTTASRPFAERRQMHVVFCDMVDSTALSARLDPEDLRDLLQHFQLLCTDIVGRYEGYVAQFLGDGVLIYFGYPRAHEDDAQRAVRAGLDIVRAVSRGAVGGQQVQVRIGIHSGLVVVGEVGIPGRRSELAVGETPNVAARVQAEALPDTVVISDATERLVRGFFATDELGPRSLRGLKQTKRLFAVTGESSARNRLEAAAAAGLTTFVARGDELGIVSHAWREASLGRGGLLSIRGEAGVGKSRLVDAFKATLSGVAHDLVECACSEYLRNSAFHPIAAALARKLELSTSSTPESPSPAGFESFAERLGPSAPPAGVLADLLSLPVHAGEGLQDLPPAARRQVTMETLAAWLAGAAHELPKLVIVEDIHWADASTLELIEALATRLPSSRLLLVVTFRPDFSVPWAIKPPATVLQLQPLTRAEASLVAFHVAKSKRLPPELTSRIDDWTRGVPLYIEEFTKGLLESGTLIEREDRFELSGPLPKSMIPETLAGPLAARIDRLGTAKPVLQLAAALGMEVRYDVLAAVSGSSESALREALDRLLASELLVESTLHPGAAFQFRHALIRDAAYNSLLLADRRAIHGRVVQAIRTRFAEVFENRPEILAYHAGEAGLAELATTEWARASERALARAANLEALVQIEEGLKQLERGAPGPDRLERQLAFELARGPALMAVKGFADPEVNETYRRAQALSEQLGNPSRLYPVLWGLWAHRFVAGELVAARTFAEQVLAIAKDTGEPSLLVPAYHALGYTLCYMAEFEQTLELARAGIALFDLEVERRNVRAFQFSSTVALHSFAATALWMLGFPDQASAAAQAAVDLGKVLSHPPTLAYAYSALTFGAPFFRGELEALDAAAREASEVSREEKFSLWPAALPIFKGWSTALAGDVHTGLAMIRDGFAMYRSIGGGIVRTTMRALMAEVAWRAGDPAGALQIVNDALLEVTSTQEHNYEPELHRVKGNVLASLGTSTSPEDAERSFRAAIDLSRAQRARSLELRAAVAFARFLNERGRSGEGLALVKQTLEPFREGLETRDLREARELLSAAGAT